MQAVKGAVADRQEIEALHFEQAEPKLGQAYLGLG